MKSYYYFLIPDALAWDMPKLYNKRLLTECYTNLADVKVRYQQLREQPYNYETAFDYITGCPYADSISTGVVMPVALTLLALFMILELYNATQRIAMNGSNNAFTIQQIALVMLKIVVCRWAVVHTTEILNALFEIASTVTVGISGYVGSGEVNTTVDIENAIAALPGGIGNMPVALELMVVGWMLRIVNIVVNTIVAARFIELYVYNAMASLSIATLCYQELHGIAVNFLKSYLAVALQGAVLYLVIGFYPALAGSLGTGGSITEQAWAMLGQSVILLVAVFMSGKFTKAITNAMA